MTSAANPDIQAAPSGYRPAPFESRFIEAGGVRLHCLDYGTEGLTPMLCLHGGAVNAHWFDFVAAGFTAGYHVRALDQRGHGDSAWVDPPAYSYYDYASDIDKVAAKLDLRDFVLVGHSMGGMVSTVYAATYPGRLKKLVIVDTSVRLSEERLTAMRDVGNRTGSNYATREELVARYRLRPAGTLASPEVVRHVGGHSARQFPDGSWRFKFDRAVYATRENLDGMPFWERIKVPALLVKGGRSPRISPEIFAEVKKRAPQVELAEVADSDHHVTLDNPDGFVRAVKPFLTKP
jgi:pimeloyl-ACP methyl ester carboxylesterase